MPVFAKFACDGCSAEAPGRSFLRHPYTVEAVTPPGWVAFGLFANCCYCPSCACQLGLELEEAAV